MSTVLKRSFEKYKEILGGIEYVLDEMAVPGAKQSSNS